jgi:formiminoglutamate deiminase
MPVLYFDRALLPEGWARNVRVTLEGERIVAVQAGADASETTERHAVGLPGLCNGHSHAFQRAMAGLAETRGSAIDSFWTWRDTLYRFLERIDPEEMEAIAALAFAEMLECGLTRVAEFHYVHHTPDGSEYPDIVEMAARIAAAAARTGIGLTLLPVYYAHSGFGGAPPAPGQRRFVCDRDRFARLLEGCRAIVARLPGATLGVAPHSLRAVTETELRDVLELSATGPVHIHVAEQLREVEDCLAWSGQRPIDWLVDRFAVDERWSLIHATHASASELDRVRIARATVGLCPITEANLGDGVFPAREFLAAGGAFSIGSDSNVVIDAAGELRMLEYGQRLWRRERNVLGTPPRSTGRSLFEGALHGGARALGVQRAGIVAGASADLFSLDANTAPLHDESDDAALDAWIFGSRCATADCVWSRGEKVVERGRHVRRTEIEASYRRALAALR